MGAYVHLLCVKGVLVGIDEWQPGPEVIFFSCSTQLSMTCFLLTNVQTSNIVPTLPKGFSFSIFVSETGTLTVYPRLETKGSW